MSILLGILTFILIIVSVFLVLVVLAQKSKDGGVGAALGGGATEAAFGADTGNVLTNATKYATILFFVLAFALYLGRIYERKQAGSAGGALPAIAAEAPATPAAATPAPAASTTTTSSPEVKLPAAAPATGDAAATTTPAAPATPAPATTTPNPEAPKK